MATSTSMPTAKMKISEHLNDVLIPSSANCFRENALLAHPVVYAHWHALAHCRASIGYAHTLAGRCMDTYRSSTYAVVRRLGKSAVMTVGVEPVDFHVPE